MYRSRCFRLIVLALAFGLVTACAGRHTVDGGCQTVFGGEVCTWGVIDSNRVVEFGATVPLATIENAPPTGDMVFPPLADAVIALPRAVVRETGFNHFSLNWERHGHPPALFFTPHFDFHFYTVEPDAVQAIDCADLRKPARLPAAYALPDIEIPGMGTMIGLCVPGMGMHAMPAKEVQQASPFGASVLVGYYGQETIFLEPMISRAKLEEKKSMSVPVPVLPEPVPGLLWPSRFIAAYDAQTKTYRLVFSGFPGS